VEEYCFVAADMCLQVQGMDFPSHLTGVVLVVSAYIRPASTQVMSGSSNVQAPRGKGAICNDGRSWHNGYVA